jgi:hypothetical protein
VKAHLAIVAVWFAAGCTIDPVARAELAGDATGDAIFQQSGTSDQVSYQITLAGTDGTYDVRLAHGTCDDGGEGGEALGTIDVVAGVGVLRAVTQDWSVAAGDARDVVGRAIVIADALVPVSCGAIFNSD